MKFRDFLIAIFLGRCVRFFTLSVLVLYFGPQIVGLIRKDFQAALDTSFKRDRRDSLFGDLCVLDQKNETGEHGELTSLRGSARLKDQGRGRSHALSSLRDKTDCYAAAV